MEHKKDRESINNLIDAALAHMRKEKPRFGEYALFQQVMGDTPKMYEAFHHFLRDVRTCPEPVIAEAQRLIAPTAS